MLRQEIDGGQDAVVGQAGVRVWAGLLQWQAAVAVRERLLGTREVLQRPRRVRGRPVTREGDQLAADVDTLSEALPFAPQRLVLDRRVAAVISGDPWSSIRCTMSSGTSLLIIRVPTVCRNCRAVILTGRPAASRTMPSASHRPSRWLSVDHDSAGRPSGFLQIPGNRNRGAVA